MWTEEASNLTRKLWAEGLSASQISRELYGELGLSKSRNAVIGRLHRLGHTKAAAPRKPRVAKAPRVHKLTAKARGLVPPKMPAPPVDELDMKPLNPALGVLGLNDMVCKYGIGDPKQEGFAFCGRTVAHTEARYCCDHMRLCYQPTRTQQRKKSDTARLAVFLDRRTVIQAKAA